MHKKYFDFVNQPKLVKTVKYTVYINIYFSLLELKIPIRIAATGVGDPEEDTKPTKPDHEGPDKGPCCPCPKSVEDLEAEAADASYRKAFENFLHNSIFTPR